MTFDLGSSNEKFEFGGCYEIERMRNGKCTCVCCVFICVVLLIMWYVWACECKCVQL